MFSSLFLRRKKKRFTISWIRHTKEKYFRLVPFIHFSCCWMRKCWEEKKCTEYENTIQHLVFFFHHHVLYNSHKSRTYNLQQSQIVDICRIICNNYMCSSIITSWSRKKKKNETMKYNYQIDKLFKFISFLSFQSSAHVSNTSVHILIKVRSLMHACLA